MAIPYLNRFTKNGLVPHTHRKSIPVGFKRPETLAEQVARLVRHSEFARMVHSQGLETFEEADDFDIDDDIPLPNTPWESDYDLPAVNAMDAGIVKTPSEEEITKSRSTLQKATDALRKGKKTAKEGAPISEAPNTEELEPPLNDSDK